MACAGGVFTQRRLRLLLRRGAVRALVLQSGSHHLSVHRFHPPGSRCAVALATLLASTHALALNPLSLIGETYADWKGRLFGKGHPTPAVVDAPATGPVSLQPGHPQKVQIGASAPERDFAKGKSHYRLLELPRELEHAAVRVQVLAQRNRHGHGNAVFKPVLYLLGSDDKPGDPHEVKPLHLDIRPFRHTRLLGCITLEKAQRIALATTPESVGKSYESEVRDAVKAPTPGGFYYSTDAVKVRLPFAATGSVVIEVTEEAATGKGC